MELSSPTSIILFSYLMRPTNYLHHAKVCARPLLWENRVHELQFELERRQPLVLECPLDLTHTITKTTLFLVIATGVCMGGTAHAPVLTHDCLDTAKRPPSFTIRHVERSLSWSYPWRVRHAS